MTTSPTRQLKMSEVFAVPSRLRTAVRSVRRGVVAGGRGGFAGRERVAISSPYSAATAPGAGSASTTSPFNSRQAAGRITRVSTRGS